MAIPQAIPWFITVFPAKEGLSIWRIREQTAEKDDYHVVSFSKAKGWKCEPGNGKSACSPGCVHLGAIALYTAGKLSAPGEPGFEHLTSRSQGRAEGQVKTQNAPAQTKPPRGKGKQTMSWERNYEQQDELLPSYPYIQWINDGSNIDPRAAHGGPAAPLDQDIAIPGVRATLHHRNGETTPVIFASQGLQVAVVRTRFGWVKDGNLSPSYVDGARGKLQALGYVKGADGKAIADLVMLTFTGWASKEFNDVRRAFAQSVRKTTKGKAPAYAFWMGFGPGEVKTVGKEQKSPVTTVVGNGDSVDPGRDYIGDQLVDAIPWEDVHAWADAWKRPGTNGTGEVHDEDANGFPSYKEGSLEWALETALPFDGQTVKKGTPLGDLSDQALGFLATKEEEFPAAAKAARIIVSAREEARQQSEEIPF